MKYLKKLVIILLAVFTLSMGIACGDNVSNQDNSQQSSGNFGGLAPDGEFDTPITKFD